MHRYLFLVTTIIFSSIFLSACSKTNEIPVAITPDLTETSILQITSPNAALSETPEKNPDTTETSSDYDLCGSGTPVQVGFFKDVEGTISPTQIIRVRTTEDEVRRYVSVVTCLVYDEGWTSNSADVINGYENVIVFFDKNGKGHQYRLIIGGQYVEPWEDGRADIVSSPRGMESGIDKKPYSVNDWIQTTYDKFVSTNVRQIGVDIYLDDTDGDLSDVFVKTYHYQEINRQIEQALSTGEGYPEDVPDDFFLFATESWLIEED